ncbi:MAG: endolytic transglycosylase MltG [Legionellales bacterium]
MSFLSCPFVQGLVTRKNLKISIITVFFILASLALFVSWPIYSLFNMAIVDKDEPALILNLDKSTSATQFAAALKEKKIIDSTRLFLSVVRFKGLAHQLKAGVYQVKPGESVMQLLSRVVAGDVLTQKFAIISGTTQLKITQELLQCSYLEYHPDDWSFIKENHASAEGLLLADTYQYRGGSSSRTLLEQAHRNLMNYLNSTWITKADNLPYRNPYELLTAASIIEKETALADERRIISGILVNRLKKGMPLQMDPTVIYGLGTAYQGKLSHNDLQIDSPYNSYRYRGLPPTPIAMIGKEAIDAAAHPQWSHYLYFVAKGDGTHQFSETYEQQRKAISQYQTQSQHKAL